MTSEFPVPRDLRSSIMELEREGSEALDRGDYVKAAWILREACILWRKRYERRVEDYPAPYHECEF